MSQLSALRNLRQILEEEEQRSREDDEQEKMSREKFRNRHLNFRAINSRNEIADRQRYAIYSGSIHRKDGIDDRPYITSDFLDRPANRVYTNGGTACNYYKSNDGKQASEAAHDIGAAEAAKVKNPNKIEGGHKATQTALQHHNSVPTNGKQVHDIGEATEMLKKEGAAKVKMPKEKEGEHKLATQTHNYGQTGLNTDYKLSEKSQDLKFLLLLILLIKYIMLSM
ncbi:uncharacterized protein LOC130718506 isoform X2 [Lotus japonicus]|uniref:uncharacterized protein LOC130718506 isoform X2 n=1 Tax=Lotus japonicus TaxID=34305 RepID=UPI002587EB86|nr:uncharacterized protein LOC130718506 isoform X2 [Lotus japonicus]